MPEKYGDTSSKQFLTKSPTVGGPMTWQLSGIWHNTLHRIVLKNYTFLKIIVGLSVHELEKLLPFSEFSKIPLFKSEYSVSKCRLKLQVSGTLSLICQFLLK
jgi:hypothetical protein